MYLPVAGRLPIYHVNFENGRTLLDGLPCKVANAAIEAFKNLGVLFYDAVACSLNQLGKVYNLVVNWLNPPQVEQNQVNELP